FQAEDGIRDKLVTGVQTCALPISFSGGGGHGPVGGVSSSDDVATHLSMGRQTSDAEPNDEPADLERARAEGTRQHGGCDGQRNRSEERRVGKECRLRK